MLADGLPAHIPYFLLLSQDDGYLWKGSTQPNPDAPPLYHFPMDSVLSRYSPGEPGERLFRTVLELVFLDWLARLTWGEPPEATEEPEKTLAQAGFIESVKDALALIEEVI